MRHGYVLLALAALLMGCASPARLPSSTSTQEQEWQGRMSVSVQTTPPTHMSASFSLRGQAQNGSLNLYSPLGTTLATLDWTANAAYMQQGQQQQRFDSLEALTEQATGAALPVSALFDWLQGTPSPAPGWQVDLSTLAQGSLKARRFFPAPEVTLRIKLD
jgi:outer membrane lipoprotein LolB